MRALTGALVAVPRVLAALGMVAIVALLILISVDVFGRYVLNAPLLFGEEVAGYLVAAVGFLGAAETLRKRRHIRIELLLDAIAERWRGRLDAATHMIGAIALTVFFWHAVVFVSVSMARGNISPSILATPLWIPQGVMLIGMTAFLVQVLIDTWHAVRSALGCSNRRQRV